MKCKPCYGDSKAINLVIKLDYVANLDANRDTILTNVAAGSPVVVAGEALLHNDSKQGGATLTGVQNASGGGVGLGGSTVTFVPGSSGTPSTLINISSEGTSDAYNYNVNDIRQNAVDFTDRSKFGTVSPNNPAWTVDQTGYSRVFSGDVDNSSSTRDYDYVKVRLYAGERLFIDIDNTTTATLARVEYQDASGAWQTSAVGNDAFGDANGWFVAPVDGEFYVRVATSTSTDSTYNLVLTVDQVRGPIGAQSGQFDYTLTENGVSTSATASVEHVAGTTINGTFSESTGRI